MTTKYQIHVPADMIYNNLSKIIVDIDMDIGEDISKGSELLNIAVSIYLYSDLTRVKEREWIFQNELKFERKYRIGEFSVYDNLWVRRRLKREREELSMKNISGRAAQWASL